MRITKSLQADQATILQFLDLLGLATSKLSGHKQARPGFFLFAHTFIHGFIESSFFKKEELFLAALENSGFPADDGPVAAMRAEQARSRESAEHMRNAAKGWQGGDEEARGEVGWAASEYAMTLRQHLERLNQRIFPLLEQNSSGEDEHRIAEGLNKLALEAGLQGETEEYGKLVDTLRDELGDWK